eukprot:4378256-Alexandrium_andersonii.AAC.1
MGVGCCPTVPCLALRVRVLSPEACGDKPCSWPTWALLVLAWGRSRQRPCSMVKTYDRLLGQGGARCFHSPSFPSARL